MAKDLTANQTRILHRDPARTLPVAIGGDGPYVIDSTGRRYLDASGASRSRRPVLSIT